MTTQSIKERTLQSEPALPLIKPFSFLQNTAFLTKPTDLHCSSPLNHIPTSWILTNYAVALWIFTARDVPLQSSSDCYRFSKTALQWAELTWGQCQSIEARLVAEQLLLLCNKRWITFWFMTATLMALCNKHTVLDLAGLLYRDRGQCGQKGLMCNSLGQ